MLIHKAALAAVLPAVGENSRYSGLGHVQIGPDGRCTATNGHVLLTAGGDLPADEDFPSKDLPVFTGSPDGAVLASVEACKALIAATAKKDTIPVLQHVQVSKGAAEGDQPRAWATDLSLPRVVTLDQADLKYPNWQRLIPATDRAVVELVLAIPVLETLLQAAKVIQASNGRKGGYVTLAIPTGEADTEALTGAEDSAPRRVCAPVGVRIGSYGVRVNGLAMPYRP